MAFVDETVPFFARFLEEDEPQDVVGIFTSRKNRDDLPISE